VCLCVCANSFAHQHCLSGFTYGFLYHSSFAGKFPQKLPLFVCNLSAFLRSVEKTMVCQHPSKVDVYFAQQFWLDLMLMGFALFGVMVLAALSVLQHL